jgi:CheY-like chemotaxis protein
MTKHLVLVVEDNPVCREHLRVYLEECGWKCVLARNEEEACEKLTDELLAVVADIDLSETGGSYTGGIVLAKKLVGERIDIPVILISQTPASFLPSAGTPEYEQRMRELKVVQVLDRNDASFWDRLVECLRKICSEV